MEAMDSGWAGILEGGDMVAQAGTLGEMASCDGFVYNQGRHLICRIVAGFNALRSLRKSVRPQAL